MRLMVMGYGEHGKDTVAEYLAEHLHLRMKSSSEFANKFIIYHQLAPKYGYMTLEDCFNDRRNHRAEWHELIKAYGKDDPARFSRALFAEYDIYCGIRDNEEFYAAKDEGLFDLAIWVDAGLRKPIEDLSSCKVDSSMADIVVDNNGTLVQLLTTLETLCEELRKKVTP